LRTLPEDQEAARIWDNLQQGGLLGEEAQQADEGADQAGENKYFRIRGENIQVYQRFGNTFREITLHVNNPSRDEGLDPAKWIRSLFSEITSTCFKNVPDDHFTALRIQVEGDTNAVWVSPCLRSQMTTDRVLNHVNKIIQSNSRFMISGQVSVTALVSTMPSGGRGGKGKLTKKQFRTMSFDEFCRSKRSIVCINNPNDDFCLARALVVGKAFADNSSNFPNIADSRRNEQGTLALQLCRAAGVNALQLSGVPELQAFQRHLLDYKITVFADRVGKNVIFEGNVNTGRYIDLIYDTDGLHFNKMSSHYEQYRS
jgi:hypothetical protein